MYKLMLFSDYNVVYKTTVHCCENGWYWIAEKKNELISFTLYMK